MPENNPKQPVKKTAEVPNTELSATEDKATRRFIIIAVAIIAVTVIVGGGLLYWLIGKFIYQTNKNKAQDQTISLLEQKKTNLELLKPNYDKIIAKGANGKSDADLILNAEPSDEGFRELIAMIERMGQESAIKVSSIAKATTTSGTSTSTGSSKSYDVTLSMDGPLSNVLTFLKKTENSSRIMDFVSMDTSKSSTGAGSTTTATFRVYYTSPADIKPTQKELQ